MNTLYDLYLGPPTSQQGFRCRTFTRQSAPLVASRFSTGQQGESDLDLLKSASLDSLEGGMFQRDWHDTQMVARAFGIFNKYDKNIYPTPPRSSGTSVAATYYPVAKAETDFVSFVALGAFSAGTYYNLLYMITLGGGVVSIALPAGLVNNGGSNITGMCVHKKYLYVGQQQAAGSSSSWRYDIDAGTWQDISGGIQKFVTLRNLLYGVQNNGHIWSVTNETAAGAATYTDLAIAGSDSPNDYVTDALEFNGAVYISKASGIYRFDGVSATHVLPHLTGQLCVFNGSIFFFSGFWLYKFDGVTVSRLQFFGSQEVPGPAYGFNMSLASNSDFLFISTVVLTSGYSTGDKVPSVASGLKRIYTYDDVGFLLFHESAETFGSGYNPTLVTNHLKLYDWFGNVTGGGGGGAWQTDYYNFSLANLFTSSAVTTASKLEFTTSEFDDGFPNIFKSLEYIEANYSGLIVGDTIAVSYRLYDGKSWSAWYNPGNITSTTTNRFEITDDNKKLFKRMQINLTLTPAAGSTASIKGVSFRYTLQPRPRWSWQVQLMAEGNSKAKDYAGTPIAADSNALAVLVEQSIKRKTPSYMFGPDYGVLDAQASAGSLSFIVSGQVLAYTDPYGENQLCAVKNANGVWEILRVSTVSYNAGTDKTTITVFERGYLGITAATLNQLANFRLCYRVYVNRLLRDSSLLSKDIYNEQPTTGESQIQREFLLELVEV